ncbi:MAG: ATP synthase F1 subunit gamma [candidate division Zixibacteria bacterium]|nr:ATP synthase F1 subunit gamma [candidate division Zixibacteria bacterium]MDH3938951.1 ATP synthase F1 subunit gamma [candidate division Zixibacteria bacterium]MDH4033962.1 ATP synthase F1 subunit gamma [candidate division Zixibacteria bacterium]
MATLREVKKSIRTVVSTQRITNAMEMVAAAKLRRAQQRIEEARPYAAKMDEMLSHLAGASTGEIVHPYFEQREIKKRTLVVVTSDRGFCGSFNSNIIRQASGWIEKHQAEDLDLITIGKKGNDFFKRRSTPIQRFWGDWGGSLDYNRAREVVAFLTDRFVEGETDHISLLYTQFVSMAKYKVTWQDYLPIPPPELPDDDDDHSAGSGEYIFEPDAEQIYAALMPGYATTKMVTALADSFASEHGSRMIAMNAATTNAGEMIQALTLEYNKARQAQITKELLEVVSGAEALKG